MYTWQKILQDMDKYFPNCTFGEDDEGQLIIYTNLVNPGDDPDIYVDRGE